MAQTSFGRRGRFWPTRWPLFHATRGVLFVLISVDMVDLHVRPLPPQRSYFCRAGYHIAIALSSATLAPGQPVSGDSSRWRYGESAPTAVFQLPNPKWLKSTRS